MVRGQLYVNFANMFTNEAQWKYYEVESNACFVPVCTLL